MNFKPSGRIIAFLLAVLMLLALFPAALSESADVLNGTVIEDGSDMLLFGSIDIDIPADVLLESFDLGDIVTVSLDGYGTFDVPVLANYDDVAAGEMLLRTVSGKSNVILAINYAPIALHAGLVETTADNADTPYTVKEGAEFPISVAISLKEAGGRQENPLSSLIRTDNRADYPALTDAQYANFRKVTVTGIADGVLYRSSSPVNPEIGRNLYADAAAAQAGIKTFINLADTEAMAASYPDYADSYYSTQNQISCCLPIAFASDSFKAGFADCFRNIIGKEGPYLVHCVEGKDRTGLMAAMLECLMGAAYEEVLNDYAETYRCYYSVENGVQRTLTDREIEAVRNIIIANLKLCFGVEVNADTDLAAAAYDYMMSIGLTGEEIAALKARLGD